MTIQELKEKKRTLEDKIIKEVRAFERETFSCVTDIYYTRQEYLQMGGYVKEIIMDVDIEVQIENN